MLRFALRRDHAVGPDPGVFVDDRRLNPRILPHPYPGYALFITLPLARLCLVKICPHKHRPVHPAAGCHQASHPDQALANP